MKRTKYICTHQFHTGKWLKPTILETKQCLLVIALLVRYPKSSVLIYWHVSQSSRGKLQIWPRDLQTLMQKMLRHICWWWHGWKVKWGQAYTKKIKESEVDHRFYRTPPPEVFFYSKGTNAGHNCPGTSQKTTLEEYLPP